ncbi:MAG: hypothetical protein NT051_03055 [Candidatus Micrarchaeota archaeon]|nr:hypothetical protein [Candidatus Micrarchaeota archaeon]
MADIQQYKKSQAELQLQAAELKDQVKEIKILHYRFSGIASTRLIAELKNGKTYDFMTKKEFDSVEKLRRFLGAAEGVSEEKTGEGFFKENVKEKPVPIIVAPLPEKTNAQVLPSKNLPNVVQSVGDNIPKTHHYPVGIAPKTNKSDQTTEEAGTKVSMTKYRGMITKISIEDRDCEVGVFGHSYCVGMGLNQANLKLYRSIGGLYLVGLGGKAILNSLKSVREFNENASGSLKMCVLFTGINDICNAALGNGNQSKIIANFDKLAEEAVKTCKPGGTVYIIGIPPYSPQQAMVDAVNKHLKEVADKSKGMPVRIVYVDTGPDRGILPENWNPEIKTVHQKADVALNSNITKFVVQEYARHLEPGGTVAQK